jgi:DNA-binding transcriptional MocR family regulator
MLPESLSKYLLNWKDPATKPRVKESICCLDAIVITPIQTYILTKFSLKILYTIPCASNPSGISASLARKHEIYRIAQQHDLLILEDDPYYYLQVSYILYSQNCISVLPHDYSSVNEYLVIFRLIKIKECYDLIHCQRFCLQDYD